MMLSGDHKFSIQNDWRSKSTAAEEKQAGNTQGRAGNNAGNNAGKRKTTLETGEEPHWKTGSEVLCTKRNNESWAGLMKSVSQSDCNLI